ncbi:hypothetical protein KIN20_001326 [Parelaphostrongylus tenuis]|uniref:Uncharacterized protein n=1 Tax=Parelaphostrongylus tenuis TaxID=148309 RepID=A0AAD5LXY1_PARTN|nr:hypothetical protein KIN20_001326 [Parelaphostrongylus tenuis]
MMGGRVRGTRQLSVSSVRWQRVWNRAVREFVTILNADHFLGEQQDERETNENYSELTLPTETVCPTKCLGLDILNAARKILKDMTPHVIDMFVNN